MKRRDALRSLLTLPAAATLPLSAQTARTALDKSAPEGPKLPPELRPTPVEKPRELATVRPDAIAEATPHFFDAEQRAAFEHLCGLLVPARHGSPGALEAHVPEFLEFLIGDSPNDRQHLYRDGLNNLNHESLARFHVSFPKTTPEQAADLLAPLRQRGQDSSPLSRFLNAAKEDVLRATANSKEWAQAHPSTRGRQVGAYWLPVE